MTKQKYASVLSLEDYIEFLKSQFAKEILSFEHIGDCEQFVIFNGTALIEPDAKPFFKNDTPQKVQDEVDFIAMFENTRCLIKFGNAEYVDLPENLEISTPYVKFLSKKLKVASEMDKSFAILRQELIALHNAKVKDNYTKSIQQAKLDYVDNMIDL